MTPPCSFRQLRPDACTIRVRVASRGFRFVLLPYVFQSRTLSRPLFYGGRLADRRGPIMLFVKPSIRVACVLCVEVHFDHRHSRVTFILCLRNVRLAFAVCTCAFWICHTFPWFVRVHCQKYCLFRSSQCSIAQPYRTWCVSNVE